MKFCKMQRPPQFTKDQRIFMVETYNRTGSIYAVQDEFRVRFPEREPPVSTTILYNVRKYRQHGTSLNRNQYNSGRRRSGRSAENIDNVRRILQNNPRQSSRRNEANLSRSTYMRIVRLDLNWFPYRMKRRHEIKEGDHARRRNYCQWFLERFGVNLLGEIVIGDEATFSLNGHVNTRNVIEYSPRGERPNLTYDVPASRDKINVWAALCGNGQILGPFFFDVNLNAEGYLNLLNEQIVPQMMEIFDFNLFGAALFPGLWWFQDGASPHGRNDVGIRLRELFGDQVVALRFDREWPPRSPDLTPCDFFLWGYLKCKVFRTPSNNIIELRMRIIEEFEALQNDREMVRRAVADMRRRAFVCIDREGGHVEGNFA